ncbi:MAG: arginine--tRNA ligase [Chloroflexota bacterium]
MIQLPKEHAKLVEQAIKAAQSAGDLPEFEIPTIPIEAPKKPEFGDYACPVALRLAKDTKMKPPQIAQAIAKHMPAADFLGAVELAGPFMNFRLDETWLKSQVTNIIAEGESLFTLEMGKDKKAQVEFVSANPTGPLHIGRSRGAIVGDATARVLEAAGYDVQREYYFNNAGVQMQNLGQSLKARYMEQLGRESEYEVTYKGDYLIDFAKELVAEHGDEWADKGWQPFKEYGEQKMFDMIRGTLERVHIKHDAFFNENSVFDSGEIDTVTEKLKASGDMYEAAVWEGANEEEAAKLKNGDPAWWFRSTKYGDDKDRVMIKGDGNATYTLPDFAYHMNKLNRGFDLAVNVLGSDHYVQAQVVQNGVTALGGDASKIRVIMVQLVRMIKDGKEVKLSTRAGDYETLDDLIDQTSVDAVRYNLLARSPNSHLDFDMNRAVAESNENPVYYIQNAHVRCAGIFREAEARGFSDEGDVDLSLLGEPEMRFLRKALEMGDVIEFAAQTLEAHKIAFYALDLASIFHPVYEDVRVLHSDVPEDVAKARLRFYRAAQVALKRVLDLMGMSAPEVM